MASREHSLTNPAWGGREEELLPLCNAAESDSANLDHVAELLIRTGVEATEALMILVPEAYRNHPDLQRNYPEASSAHPPPCCRAKAGAGSAAAGEGMSRDMQWVGTGSVPTLPALLVAPVLQAHRAGKTLASAEEG